MQSYQVLTIKVTITPPREPQSDDHEHYYPPTQYFFAKDLPAAREIAAKEDITIAEILKAHGEIPLDPLRNIFTIYSYESLPEMRRSHLTAGAEMCDKYACCVAINSREYAKFWRKSESKKWKGKSKGTIHPEKEAQGGCWIEY